MQGIVCILALAYVTWCVLQFPAKTEPVRVGALVVGIILAFVIVWVYAGHGVVVK